MLRDEVRQLINALVHLGRAPKMIGPIEDNLLSQTMATLIPLCIGAAVLTGIYQIALWTVRTVRRRWLASREEDRHQMGPV